MWLKSQYLKQSQCHFGSKTRYAPRGKKVVFGIGQRRNMLKSRYLTPAFLYAPAGCVLWYSKLSYERYFRMAAKYEKEQAELLQSVSTKEKELAELERESVDIRLLLAGLREYSSLETLTPEVVNKIIKRIEVHNSETMNGHKRVGVDIYFTGVGLVDLATIK